MTGKRKYRRKGNTDSRKKFLRSKKSKTCEQEQLISAEIQNNTATVIARETEMKLTNVEDPNSSSSTDDLLVVVDDMVDDIPPVAAKSTDPSSFVRGQKKRGRPRLRPIVTARKTRLRSPLQRRKIGIRGRGVQGRARGRAFTGRAAAMAGARAGALAATAATLQAQVTSGFHT